MLSVGAAERSTCHGLRPSEHRHAHTHTSIKVGRHTFVKIHCVMSLCKRVAAENRLRAKSLPSSDADRAKSPPSSGADSVAPAGPFAHRSTARTRPHARPWPAGATRVNSLKPRREGTQAKGQSTAKAATVNCLEWHVIASASRFHTRRRMCTIRRALITLCVATAEAENNRPC